MAERDVGDVTVPDLAGVTEHARLAVRLERSVGAVHRHDGLRYGVLTVIRGEQYPGRGRILDLDEVRLVLDFERLTEPFCERMFVVPHVDAKLAQRGMCQEEAAEEGVMLGLHRAALAHAFHPLR